MSLNKKVLTGAIFLIVIFLIIGSILLYATNKGEKDLKMVYVHNTKPSLLLFDISSMVRDVPFRMVGFIAKALPAAGNRNAILNNDKPLRNAISKFTTEFESSRHSMSGKDKEKMEKYFSNFQKFTGMYFQFQEKLVLAYEQDDTDTVEEMFEDEWPDIQIPLYEAFDGLILFYSHQTELEYERSVAAARILQLLSLLVILFAITLLVIAVFITNKKVTLPITDISDRLTEMTASVGEASMYLASVSQSLSDSSNEQASSLEETSASLEEIQVMIKNNLDNAKNSESFAHEIRKNSSDGNKQMEELVISMKDIQSSNDEVQKLVRVIEGIAEKTDVINEIVFQTKLLSFNASVEAERAGEHGRGFAVVAQEVGNLAQMSGKAAQEITQIVSSSVREVQGISTSNKEKVEKGAILVQKAAAILLEVNDKSVKLSHDMQSILRASEEQLHGINQINESMNAIDGITQNNASTSEETASSSETLKTHSNELSFLVQELKDLIMGTNTVEKLKEEKSIVLEATLNTTNSKTEAQQ